MAVRTGRYRPGWRARLLYRATQRACDLAAASTDPSRSRQKRTDLRSASAVTAKFADVAWRWLGDRNDPFAYKRVQEIRTLVSQPGGSSRALPAEHRAKIIPLHQPVGTAAKAPAVDRTVTASLAALSVDRLGTIGPSRSGPQGLAN